MHLLDVHEHCFKVVHEHIFFALLRMGNPMREHTFDVSESRSHRCSSTNLLDAPEHGYKVVHEHCSSDSGLAQISEYLGYSSPNSSQRNHIAGRYSFCLICFCLSLLILNQK